MKKLFDNPHKKYLDHGHVVLLDFMGSDEDIEYAARMSYADGTRTVSDTKRLLDFLMRHDHSSPFEMAEFKFQINMPIFVMRQLVRHRTASLNENSLRYSVATDEFYLPETSRCNPQSTTNKQCSGDTIIEDHLEARHTIAAACNESFDAYHRLLEMGLSRELARGVLPVNGYTEVVWKIDLKNLMHFLKLRLHGHAQEEIQWLAQAIYELIVGTNKFPLTLDAFDRYILNGARMSKHELELIRNLVIMVGGWDDGMQDLLLRCQGKLSEREISEFRQKIGL